MSQSVKGNAARPDHSSRSAHMDAWCTSFAALGGDGSRVMTVKCLWLLLDAGSRLAQTCRAYADWWRAARRVPAIVATVRRRREELLRDMRTQFVRARRDQTNAIYTRTAGKNSPSWLGSEQAAAQLVALFPPPRACKIRRLLEECAVPLTECDALCFLFTSRWWSKEIEQRYLEHAPPDSVAKRAPPLVQSPSPKRQRHDVLQ